MVDNPNEFTGQIVVASRIIDLLSSGLYESPAACLKELVNNSYDADASQVDIFVKPDADRIIIEDNGSGMDRADFEKNFKKISESHKREDGDKTPSGRPKIGKIGIGFIAANEICDVMEIVSTKANSNELLEVTINFDLMRQDPSLRRTSDSEFAKADYVGKVSETSLESHFTKIFLKKVRGDARSILSGAGVNPFTAGDKPLYGLNMSSIFKQLSDPSLKSWTDFDTYSKNRLEVALNVPVRYYENWMPSNLRKEILDFEKNVDRLNFSLSFDGSEIRKPIVYNPGEKRALISRFEFEGKNVSAQGYFYAQHTRINPQDLQGLLVRIRNSAVGGYDPNFWGYSPTIGPLFQSWISGEIMADDRLEDAMNIDRKTLRIAHPAYVELQEALHSHLDQLIRTVKSEIYNVGSQQRHVTQAQKVQNKILTIATQRLGKSNTVAATQLKNAWHTPPKNRENQRNLLRKYTVDEFYEIVVDVAQEVLSREQLIEFLAQLTGRLQK